MPLQQGHPGSGSAADRAGGYSSALFDSGPGKN